MGEMEEQRHPLRETSSSCCIPVGHAGVAASTTPWELGTQCFGDKKKKWKKEKGRGIMGKGGESAGSTMSYPLLRTPSLTLTRFVARSLARSSPHPHITLQLLSASCVCPAGWVLTQLVSKPLMIDWCTIGFQFHDALRCVALLITPCKILKYLDIPIFII